MYKKPIIGLTSAYVKHNEFMEGVYIHHDYHKSVAANGGIPIILPYINTLKEVRNYVLFYLLPS